MSRESQRTIGLTPEIFNSIDTPHLPSSIGIVSEGIPTYATLDVLVAYLTAPNLLNYEVMQEFLMVYRSFSTSTQLWQLLTSRLLWAADSAVRNTGQNETGQNVGTRCFVLLRMWLRTYFYEDFVSNLELRLLAAESLQVLSSCTGFVLVDLFSTIIQQLRVEWDTQINKYWVLPPDIAGNVEAMVPTGGEPIVLPDSKVPKGFLFDGSIKIDPNIAVPSIRASPQKLRPKKKLSVLFGLKSNKPSTNDEVILHDKVDLLSMKINEDFHEWKWREALKLNDTMREIDPELVSYGPRTPRRAPRQTSRRDFDYVDENEEFETPRRVFPPASSTNLANGTFGSPFESPTRPKSSPERSPERLYAGTNDNFHHNGYPSPERPTSDFEIFQSPTKSLRMFESESNLDIKTESSSTLEPRSQSKSETPSELQSYSTGYEPSHSEVELDRNLSVLSQTPRATNSDFQNSLQTEDTPSSSILGPEDDAEIGWGTPVRFSEHIQADDSRLPSSESQVMSHEQSSDTLNVNNMVLANTTGDSVEEFIRSRQSAVLEDMRQEEEERINSERLRVINGSTSTINLPSTANQGSEQDTDEDRENTPLASDNRINDKKSNADDEQDKQLDVRDGSRDSGDWANQSIDKHDYAHTEDSAALEDTSLINRLAPEQRSREPSFDEEIDAADDWNALDYDALKRVSFVGSALSTLSTSTRSAFSAHAPHTPSSAEYEKEEYYSNIRHSSGENSISLMSEVENSMLQPCEGYTPTDAERLRSLPDTKLEGDALQATLDKLEGHSSEEQRLSWISQQQAQVKEPEQKHIRLLDDVMGLGISTNDQSITPKQSQFFPSQPAPSHLDSYRKLSEFSQAPEQFSFQRSYTSELSHSLSQQFPNRDLRAIPADYSDSSQIRQSGLSSMNRQPDIPDPLPTLHIGLTTSTHAPFVLSYNARTFAEQMTLIEREIAKELDWQELTKITSPSSSKNIHSWLQVVVNNPPLMGVELVKARFDIVYRWVQSEVLLCPTAALQAQAVSRFIHIAFESLRLQNFATMTQLVLALSSSEVESHLGLEYANLIPKHDRDTLDLLLSLASPRNNYAKLRNAHSRYSWAKGCVPYTPMFLSDIAELSKSVSSNTENEIHFGKYHEISRVVLSLKRCVESGSRYNFEPDNAIISKALHLTSM